MVFRRPWHYIMHTVWLWMRLKRPPAEHPILQRVSQRQATHQPHYMLWGVVSLVIFYVGISLLFGNRFASNISGGINGYVVAMFAVPVMVFVVVFSGTTYGVVWAGRIAMLLATYREQGLSDLLALTPLTLGGVNWLLAISVLHRDRAMLRIPALEAPISKSGQWVLLSLAVILMLHEDSREIFAGAITILAIGLAVYIDFMQSCELALLVGIHSAQWARTTERAFLNATVGFLALQFSAYVLIGLGVIVSIGIVQRPYWHFGGLPQLLIFYMGREPIIALLWHNAQPFLRVIPG